MRFHALHGCAILAAVGTVRKICSCAVSGHGDSFRSSVPRCGFLASSKPASPKVVFFSNEWDFRHRMCHSMSSKVIRGLDGCSLLAGEGRNVVVVIIWCCGMCFCVCVFVVASIERGCSEPMTGGSVYEASEKPLFSCCCVG